MGRDHRQERGVGISAGRPIAALAHGEGAHGYTAPKGGRRHLGALLVGLYDKEKLRYVGKVGTGFTEETLNMLARKLAPLRTDTPPFDPPPRMRDATWVQPNLVAQLVYAEWTADGKLRQPAFLGLRTDKSPRECTWSDRER